MDFYDERDYLSSKEISKNSKETKEKSEIHAFYANKNIFITGASGFLGTLILEKLLRSCSDLNMIYILFRSSKRKNIHDRIKEYFNDPVFDKMKFENPKYYQQVRFLEGDLCSENLGLSIQDVQDTICNTNVIIHVAATVKFDEHLEDAYNINVNGTISLIRLAESMKELQSFIYVSTAYSNCDRQHIDECFYEPVFTDKEVVQIIKHSKRHEQAILTPLILGNKPNTYIFTKSLSEYLVKNNLHLPLCVVRPSIIMPTLTEPMPYWTRSQNSMLSMAAGVGLGLLRVVCFGEEVKADMTPGDLTANCILAAGWNTSTKGSCSPKIYNCVGYESAISLSEFLRTTSDNHIASKECVNKIVWQSHMIIVQQRTLLFLLSYLLHVLPGLIFTLAEKYMNRKPIIMKIYRKTFFLAEVIRYFCFKEWSFSNDNTKDLLNKMNSNDRETFDFDFSSISWRAYATVLYRCISLYVIKDYAEYPKEVYKKQMRFIDPIDTSIVWAIRGCSLYIVLKLFQLGYCYIM